MWMWVSVLVLIFVGVFTLVYIALSRWFGDDDFGNW
jgi:O-antigen/teichoic acid export membrane protein